MDYKPRDLFLSAIDIFAIFFPGAMMLYLHLDIISKTFTDLFHIQSNGAEFWAAFIICAYIVGQFLIAEATLLNKIENAYASKKILENPLFLYVKKYIPHEAGEEINRLKAFYRSYSFIRLNNANGLSEIEKQTADYKLFRSLTLVAFLEVVFSLLLAQWARAAISLATMFFCFWRFMYLRRQTEVLAFEFFYLLKKQEEQDKKKIKRNQD
jgi:hypothetical protein